jgi:hypothetical protein
MASWTICRCIYDEVATPETEKGGSLGLAGVCC